MVRRKMLWLMPAMVSILTLGRRVQAQGPAVQLLLVRNGDYARQCVNCIPGRLYGVPNAIDFGTAEVATSFLAVICDTIELSYEDNRSNASSIPTGTYDAVIRADGTKRWMWTGGEVSKGSLVADRAWRLDLQGVPGHRTAIQFHYGQDVGWSKGCIILGTSNPNTCHDDCRHTDSPALAVRALREYVEAGMIASNTPIKIRIADG